MPQAKTATGVRKKASARTPPEAATRRSSSSPRSRKTIEETLPPAPVVVTEAAKAPSKIAATTPKRARKASKPGASTARPRKKTIKPGPSAVSRTEPPAPPVDAPEESIVAAAKFGGAPRKIAGPAAQPTLPSTYGESRLLLLARDPKTLFAAWDIAPGVVEALKSRIGARAFAVSPFTLRLNRPGGSTSEIHVGRQARSRYIRIDSGPSFTAEIGFTTPSGSFEPIAKSPTCFVPMGPLRQAAAQEVKRTTLSYRDTRSSRRREALKAAASRVRAALRKDEEAGGDARAAGGRVIGGASDLYRR